jgi:hypothetical protein
MSDRAASSRRLQPFYGKLPAPPRESVHDLLLGSPLVHAASGKRAASIAALKRIRALTPDAMWRAPQARLEASGAPGRSVPRTSVLQALRAWR